ncbi:hypothetical protein GQ54DRAFT_75270 [Martensiomyces pterosporus]|nr:hypothetical protein GQ54DRAFT_75270 [Martensiomyces pterosporus]
MSSLDQTSSKTQQNIDRNSAQDAAESLGAMADHIVQDEEISVAQDGGVVHEEVEEYEGNGDLRLSEVAAHMVAAAKSSEEAGEDYEMVGHHQEAEVGNGEEVLDQEAYGAEHEYAEYDMAEVDMTQGVEGDQGAQAAEYADNVAGTDAGSILATQDNGEEDQLLDDGQQNAEYSYDQEMIDEGEKAQGMGIDENGEEIVDDHGHHQHHAQTGQQLEHQDQQVSHESEHQQGMYDEQDDQSGQMYESAPVDAAPMDYTIISTAAANSSLAALSQAITSSVSRLTGDLSTEDQELHEHHEHQLLQQPDDGQDGHLQGQDQEQASQEQQQEQQEQEQGQQDQEPKDHHDAGGYALSSDLGSHGSVQQGLPHSEPHSHSHSHTHSPSPLAGNSGGAVSTPIGYKTSGRLMESQNVTPAKRPHSSHGAASSNSRLKSKVWNWYDILPDSYRQCRFCPQKYGPLTATTILARHYHNRHDLNPPVGGTPSHRGSASHVHAGSQGTHTPTHQHLALSQAGQAVYNQAAAAAAAAAAAVTANGGATPAESQTGHIFHAQSNGGSAYGQSTLAVANGTATDEILRSVVSEAVQNGPYEENQIIMQGKEKIKIANYSQWMCPTNVRPTTGAILLVLHTAAADFAAHLCSLAFPQPASFAFATV